MFQCTLMEMLSDGRTRTKLKAETNHYFNFFLYLVDQNICSKTASKATNYNKIRGETEKETKVLILLGISRAEADSPCVQRIVTF